MEEEIPMGVSQWREHGKKFGYWKFFERKCFEVIWAKAKLLPLIENELRIILPGSSRFERKVYLRAYNQALEDQNIKSIGNF